MGSAATPAVIVEIQIDNVLAFLRRHGDIFFADNICIIIEGDIDLCFPSILQHY